MQKFKTFIRGDEKIKSITYQIRKTAKSHNINGDIRIVSISEKGAHIKT